MKSAEMMLNIARDEIDTLIRYREMLLDAAQKSEITEEKVIEIMGDEFNHALIAIYSAAGLLGITIPADGIIESMEEVDFTEEEDMKEGIE